MAADTVSVVVSVEGADALPPRTFSLRLGDPKSVVRVGRQSSKADLCINSSVVSNEHFELRAMLHSESKDDPAVPTLFLRDLSSNGTLILRTNGQYMPARKNADVVLAPDAELKLPTVVVEGQERHIIKVQMAQTKAPAGKRGAGDAVEGCALSPTLSPEAASPSLAGAEAPKRMRSRRSPASRHRRRSDAKARSKSGSGRPAAKAMPERERTDTKAAPELDRIGETEVSASIATAARSLREAFNSVRDPPAAVTDPAGAAANGRAATTSDAAHGSPERGHPSTSSKASAPYPHQSVLQSTTDAGSGDRTPRAPMPDKASGSSSSTAPPPHRAVSSSGHRVPGDGPRAPVVLRPRLPPPPPEKPSSRRDGDPSRSRSRRRMVPQPSGPVGQNHPGQPPLSPKRPPLGEGVSRPMRQTSGQPSSLLQVPERPPQREDSAGPPPLRERLPPRKDKAGPPPLRDRQLSQEDNASPPPLRDGPPPREDSAGPPPVRDGPPPREDKAGPPPFPDRRTPHAASRRSPNSSGLHRGLPPPRERPSNGSRSPRRAQLRQPVSSGRGLPSGGDVDKKAADLPKLRGTGVGAGRAIEAARRRHTSEDPYRRRDEQGPDFDGRDKDRSSTNTPRPVALAAADQVAPREKTPPWRLGGASLRKSSNGGGSPTRPKTTSSPAAVSRAPATNASPRPAATQADGGKVAARPEAGPNSVERRHYSGEELEEYRKKCMEIYAKFNPDKLADSGRLFKKYAGAEHRLYEALVEKYLSAPTEEGTS